MANFTYGNIPPANCVGQNQSLSAIPMSSGQPESSNIMLSQFPVQQQTDSEHPANEIGSSGLNTESKSVLDRWELDEPLGDKATTAAVLYTNLHHSDLKVGFLLALHISIY